VNVEEIITKLKSTGHKIFDNLDRVTGGVIGILADAVMGFTRSRGPEAAASITYYFLFSIFPLLLSVVSIGSFFLEVGQIRLQVVRLVLAVVPVEPELIVQNIEEVLQSRGTFGFIGVIGLVWSASAAFTTIFRNINRAWVRADPLNILLTRLVGVLLIFGIVLLLVFVRVASAAVNLLPAMGFEFVDNIYDTYLWIAISSVIPLLLTFLLFLGLYRWIPNTRVRWSEAFWGALLVSIGYELSTNIFTLFLSEGILEYQVVYGSLGTMIALLFWLYINNMIILFGSHLCAAIARHQRPLPQKPAEPQSV
jgi:membrane protein